MQEQTAALVAALQTPSTPVDYDALATAIAKAIAPLVNRPERVEVENPRLENDFPAFQRPTALPSKMELAKQWLVEHPEDMALTGRELKEQRRPMDVEISHKTWNDAKKLIEG